MNYFGILIGIATLFIIGFGFIWVIQGERLLGLLWWPYLMAFGVLLVVGSLFIPWEWAAALTGAFGGSMIWGSTEFKEQAIRAELGWYPLNAKGKPSPPFASIIKKWKAPHL